MLSTLAAGCHRRGARAATAIAQPPSRVRSGAKAGTGAANPALSDAVLAGFCDGVGPVEESERARRREHLAQGLRAAGDDAIVVEPGANMEYVGSVRWGTSERPFLAVLRSDASVAWVCPAFEERSAREQVGEQAEVALWQEHEDPYALAVSLAGGAGAAVAVDPRARGFIFEGLRRHAARTRLDGALLEAARLHKDPRELARLRRANEATKAAIAVAAADLQLGMTQSAFAARLVGAQQAAGLQSVWCLALFGPAASFPHGTREDRALGPGDVVLVDTGGSLHGYRSDVSRTWVPGTATADVREAWMTVAAAQAAALQQIRPGARCRVADEAAREVLAGAGFGAGYEHFTHRLGHGIGLEVHEAPYLRPSNDRVLEAAMTMSNEPGIYVPGAFGIRIEDIVAVTPDGAEVLGPAVGPFEDPLAGHAPS